MQFNRNDSETEILFEKRPPQVTEVTRTKSSFGTVEDPVQPFVESGRRDPMRSYVEPARRNPLRNNIEQVQNSHNNLRNQGERTVARQRGPGKRRY